MGVTLDPPPATVSVSPLLPSEYKWLDRMPRPFSEGASTTAPAPSPQRTQVARSFQLTTRVMISAPTNSARRTAPLRMNWSATLRP